MTPIIYCDICGSEKFYGRQCLACEDMTDEQWALRDAADAYARDDIDIDELERRIETALTNPPKRYHPHIVIR